jgi:hypothetical protein
MSLRMITLSLEPKDIIRLMRAVLDEDPEEALSLLPDGLYPRLLKELSKSHCLPSFELEARKRAGADSVESHV